MHVLSAPLMTAISVLAFGASPLSAHVFSPKVAGPDMHDNVACRVVRERVERPFGPAEFREQRICEPDLIVDRPDCIVRRERVVRPNGSVVYRTIRRCD